MRKMAADGKHDVGQATEVLGVYQEMGSDIIGLQEARRSGRSTLLQAEYAVYCSGESGRRVKVKLDWLFARVSPMPIYDPQSSSATGY